MDLIDLDESEHAPIVARVLVVAASPGRCNTTREALDDLLLLGITKANVLDGVLSHAGARKPVYRVHQKSGATAFVFLPCHVEGYELYVKLQLMAGRTAEEDRITMISAHPPKFPVPKPKGEKK